MQSTGPKACHQVSGPGEAFCFFLCFYMFRMGEFFKSGQLVEINSHSLFSKWFSESGKLVQKMFTEIKRLMEDQE